MRRPKAARHVRLPLERATVSVRLRAARTRACARTRGAEKPFAGRLLGRDEPLADGMLARHRAAVLLHSSTSLSEKNKNGKKTSMVRGGPGDWQETQAAQSRARHVRRAGGGRGCGAARRRVRGAHVSDGAVACHRLPARGSLRCGARAASTGSHSACEDARTHPRADAGDGMWSAQPARTRSA